MKLHLSFLTSLFLLLLGLKLAGVITWPWLWVFAPLWAPVGSCGSSGRIGHYGRSGLSSGPPDRLRGQYD